MLKDIGLLVNCGRWHLTPAPKRESVAINFVISVEVMESESSDAVDELRSAFEETVALWSRTGWRKMKKHEREQKAAKKQLQREVKIK